MTFFLSLVTYLKKKLNGEEQEREKEQVAVMKEYLTETIKEESLHSLKKIIAIPSVNTTLDDEVAFPPFGKEIDRALRETLALCEKLGMETFYDPEGYYGFADYGEGDETVGVLCHLDVVPEGDREKWQTDPFVMTEREEFLYGRGVQDDKGPTVAALYALKSVMDAGETFNKKIRFIFGTDEETLWRCIRMYKKHEALPDFGFVPDGSFPLTYAEKGLLQVRMTGPGAAKMRVKCGQSVNVVPDYAEYTSGNIEELAAAFKHMRIPYKIDGEKIIVHGKTAHASEAHEGKNAITILAKGLVGVQPHPVISLIAEKIGLETNGESLFGEVIADRSGELTLNVGKLEINDNYSEFILDIRIPVSYNKDEIEEKLIEVGAMYGMDYQVLDYLPSLHVPIESELVQTLWSIYREKTEDTTIPNTSGGVSFARAMPNFVAFGARFPESKSTAHQENECMKIEHFYKALSIYAETIYQLCCKV